MKIKIKEVDKHFFHPLPSAKQVEMLRAIQDVLSWEFPISEIKREQAEDIIDRGMRAAKRKGLHLLMEHNNPGDKEIRKVNEELQTICQT